MRLYQAEWCPFSHRVRAKLTELGVDYELVNLPASLKKCGVLEKVAGTTAIPVLVDGGRVVSDSNEAISYLEKKYGTDPDELGVHRRELSATVYGTLPFEIDKAAGRLREALAEADIEVFQELDLSSALGRGVRHRHRQRHRTQTPHATHRLPCGLCEGPSGAYSSSISSPTRTVPFPITLAQIPPRPLRAWVMPGSVRRSMYRQTERGPLYSNATSPTRNRSPRRKAFRLIPLVTTLRRCSPFFTPTPVSRSMSWRFSAAMKVTSQILPKRLQCPVPAQ